MKILHSKVSLHKDGCSSQYVVQGDIEVSSGRAREREREEGSGRHPDKRPIKTLTELYPGNLRHHREKMYTCT